MTRYPTVVGGAVLGLKYNGGVMLAADTLCSYGTMAKFKQVSRLRSIQNNVLLGAGGEYSDFQSIVKLLEADALERECNSNTLQVDDDEQQQCAKEIWHYLRHILYNRRNKMNPFWNDVVIAGHDATTGTPFLGWVDRIGTAIEEDLIATGFGAYLALPLMRERFRPDLEEGEARALLEDALRILFYRNCRAIPRIQIAKVDANGNNIISEPYELETSWDATAFQKSVANLEDDGGW